LKTAKPSIDKIAGRTGFPREIGASQLSCLGCCTLIHNILHHTGHDKGIARINHTFCPIGNGDRLELFDDVAFLIFDFLDEIRCNAETAVGKNRISGSHLHRCDGTRAERHR